MHSSLCSCRRFCIRNSFRAAPLASLIRQLGKCFPRPHSSLWKKDLGVNKAPRGAWTLLEGARGLFLGCCASRNREFSAMFIPVVAACSCRGVLRCCSALGGSKSVPKGGQRGGRRSLGCSPGSAFPSSQPKLGCGSCFWG